jgi:hypothetical protein
MKEIEMDITGIAKSHHVDIPKRNGSCPIPSVRR